MSNLKYAKTKVKQFDSKFRYLTIILNDNGKPLNIENNSIKVYVGKSDGTYVLNDVKYIDVQNGVIEVEITAQMTSVVGSMPCELVIWDNSRAAIMTSYKFDIVVEKTHFNQAKVTSENEFGVLGNIAKFRQVVIEEEMWIEASDGLYECVFTHGLNVANVFAKGIGEDNKERFLAVEYVDSLNTKIITDTKEKLNVILDYKFS